MKKFYIVFVLICLTAVAFGQAPAENIPSGRSYFHEKIDDIQKQILAVNGVNGYINTAASTTIDNLQSSIEKDAALDNNNKIKFLRGLDEALRTWYAGVKSHRYDVRTLPDLVKAFEESIHIELNNQSLEGVIEKNSYDVGVLLTTIFAYSKNTGMEAAKNFMLCKYIGLHPAQLIPMLSQHPDLSCADSLLAIQARRDPEI